MNIAQTALVYGGIPLAIALALAAAVFGRTATQPNRYRPGRPWTYDPVWYLGSPTHLPTAPTLPAGATQDQRIAAETLTAAEAQVAMGGASGEW